MGHFVQDHFRAVEPLQIRRGITEDHALREGDRADVLHGPRVELRDEDLVVLVERIGAIEELAEVGQALPGDLEKLVAVDVWSQ